jgi:hypothetical protein
MNAKAVPPRQIICPPDVHPRLGGISTVVPGVPRAFAASIAWIDAGTWLAPCRPMAPFRQPAGRFFQPAAQWIVLNLDNRRIKTVCGELDGARDAAVADATLARGQWDGEMGGI